MTPPSWEVLAPFLLCAGAGATLASVELLKTFGRWIGGFLANRYVAFIYLLNIATALAVFAFLRYVLGVQNPVILAITTGITFPTILRTRFTFYRPAGKTEGGVDAEAVSLTLDDWYRGLQDLCYEAVNNEIAAARAKVIKQLRTKLTEPEMKELLQDHIDSGKIAATRGELQKQMDAILSLPSEDDRKRRLAILIVDVMPGPRVRELLG